MAGAFATCMQPMKAPSDILGSGVNCNTVLYRTRHAASSRVPKASTAQLRRQCASTPGTLACHKFSEKACRRHEILSIDF